MRRRGRVAGAGAGLDVAGTVGHADVSVRGALRSGCALVPCDRSRRIDRKSMDSIASRMGRSGAELVDDLRRSLKVGPCDRVSCVARDCYTATVAV